MDNFDTIKTKSLSKGKAKSIRMNRRNGQVQAIGAMLPGTHDFGIAVQNEEWIVIDSKLEYGGTVYTKTTGKKKRLRFKPGSQIFISCDAPAFYLCRFGTKSK